MDDEKIFLNSWSSLIEGHQSSVDSLILTCHKVAKEYSDSKENAEQDRFNLFHVISDLYYRENFHSDMIAFFLDPNANHGYKHLMLYNFISVLNDIGYSIDKANYQDAVVIREEGRIDILIKSDSSKRAIIIENKINNAGDMPRQLPRYYDYIIVNYHIDAIVYLPLDRNKYPDTDSWTDVDKKHVFPILKIIPAYDNMHKINIAESWL